MTCPTPPPTADLLDLAADLAVADPLFTDFGGTRVFHGPIRTCTAPADNSRVRELLAEPGEGAVLVVEGGGSRSCALLGDRLGDLAVTNGWSGVVVHGCVRDTAVLKRLPIGVRALAALPRKSIKRGLGERDVELFFAGVHFVPGDHLVADEDGLVVVPKDRTNLLQVQP